MNSQTVDRAESDFCGQVAKNRLSSKQGAPAAGAYLRPTRPLGVSPPAAPARGDRQFFRPFLAAGFSKTFRFPVSLFTRRRAVMGLVLVLAALLTVPMPATPQGSCIENCPVFSSTTPLSFTISEDEGLGEVIAIMPTATDADQDDEHLIYSLWDRDDPIVNGDRNDAGFGVGDAAAFDLEVTYDYQDEKIKFALETNDAYDFETKQVYEFRLVACDNDYNRVYIDITVRIGDEDEPPDSPGQPTVTGASTTEVVVRWSPPTDRPGQPPVTDYDLQYRKNGTTDNWRSWSHNGTETNAVISGLEAATEYEVQVLARNHEGASGWSPSGTGSTHASGGGGPPVFLEGDPVTRSFAENTPPGRNVGAAVQAEGEGTLTYSLESGAASFDIVASSGQIRTKSGVPYDYEDQISNTYSVMVKATDSNMKSATIDVTISLTDVDEPPLRPAAPSVASGPNPDSDTSLSVSWTEPDNTGRPNITDYDVQYRRQGTSGWNNWPHNETGTSTTITGLEPGTWYQVQVLARNDEGDSPWSQPGSGKTNAAGNNTPMFQDTSTTRSINENTAAGEPVGDPVTATDTDADDTLRYRLEGADARSFVIDSGSGQIRTKSGVTYDFESKRSYSVTVKATDSDDASATIAVTINLLDQPEAPDAPAAPTVTGRSTESLSVSWQEPDNRSRPEIVSYDLQYRQGTGGTWINGPQDVLGTSTTIQDVTPPLSPDTQYQVQVRATNHEDDGPWSPPGSGRTLKPPTFADDSTTRSFRETMGVREPASRNIGASVRATYAGGTLTYSLEGADAGSFDIDEGTGQIKTRTGETYNYEAQAPGYSYSVTVRARDPDNSGATVAVTVTINITDANEPPLAPGTPEVLRQSDTSLSVSWVAPVNTGRPAITGYDLQYRQGISGNWRDVPQEDVSERSATITGLSEDTQYQVQVRATNDEGNGPYSQPGFGGTGTGNPGNNPPTFDEGTLTTRSFPENTPPNRNIGAPVMATDQDAGETLTYSLHGTDATSFKIDFGTGQLRTKSGVTYDYETKPLYMVMVRVTDSSNATDSISVTINVTDADEGGTGPGGNGRPPRSSSDDEGPSIGDAKPTFPDAAATRSLEENTEPDLNIGAPVTATDPDGGPLTYTLEGADAGSFHIKPKTGQLKTKAGVTYDYETKDTYTVTVKATDSSRFSDTIAVTILVTDVDEKPTTPDAPTVSAPEGSTTSLLATWTTPDRTGGPPITDYDVEYRRGTSGDWSDWGHDGTGTTTMITGLAPHTDYQVRVRASNGELHSDWSPPGSGQTNNTVPAFADTGATRSFPENTPPGQDIGPPVAAGDPDGDPLVHTLSGPDAPSFDIEPSTGQLKTKAGVTYDYEVKSSYSVTVEATDTLDATADIGVTINVINVAEKPATPDAPTVSAPDGTNTSLLVTWTAPELNGGPLLTDYDLEYRQGAGGDWSTWPHDGIDTSAMMMGLRPHTDYQVRVQAFNGELHSDWSLPGNGQTNNTAPSFVSAAATRSFPENTSSGQGIGAPVAATDADGDELTYTLGGADAASFDIAETGEIKTRSGVSYDYEVRASYAVTVQATDSLGASGSIAVTIDVTDVAEPPAMPDAPTVSAPDGTNTSLLVTWTAPDLNGGPLLTDYDVQYRQGTAGDWDDWQHDGTATTATITGLDEGAGYQVRVRALNDEAASDWSPPGSGRTNATMDRWLGRFGRSIAQQMMDGVEERLASPCRTGLQGTLAGYGFGGDRHLTLHDTGDRLARRDGSGGTPPYWAGGDLEAEGGSVTGRTLLAGTEFELGSETDQQRHCLRLGPRRAFQLPRA